LIDKNKKMDVSISRMGQYSYPARYSKFTGPIGIREQGQT
jgi:hypothetical protein